MPPFTASSAVCRGIQRPDVESRRGMKRLAALGALLAMSLIPTAGRAAPVPPAGTVTVFAAASLREAFETAAVEFTKRTGTSVTFEFGGSDTLATQIAQGAPASVFASANRVQMKKLAGAGLLAGPPVTLARNRLVIVTPAANPREVRALADLGHAGVSVVLAAATVPVGSYARAAFAKVDGHDGYGSGFASAVEKNVVSNELDVKAVATKIALGEADAGIVYATDVTPELASKLRVIALPSEAVIEALYPIAACTAASDPASARAFVDFMLGDGQRFLRARGFLSP